MLTPFVLFLGAACMTAVLKSRPQEAQVPRFVSIDHPQAQFVCGWDSSVPVSERFQRVTIIPGFIKATPDTNHYARLEAHGLREIHVSRAGQTVERRTFPLGQAR